VEYFHVQSSEGGSPQPMMIKDQSLGLVSKFDYALVHTEFMGSLKVSSFDGRRVG
jgi:hypothetical protein